eukprot:9412408-Alexandrium_andersonii.AAC.1
MRQPRLVVLPRNSLAPLPLALFKVLSAVPTARKIVAFGGGHIVSLGGSFRRTSSQPPADLARLQLARSREGSSGLVAVERGVGRDLRALGL